MSWAFNNKNTFNYEYKDVRTKNVFKVPSWRPINSLGCNYATSKHVEAQWALELFANLKIYHCIENIDLSEHKICETYFSITPMLMS